MNWIRPILIIFLESMPTAGAKVKDRRAFVSTSQLHLRKRQFLLLTLWAFLASTLKGAFLIFGCDSLSGRGEPFTEFRREVARCWCDFYWEEVVLVLYSTAIAFYAWVRWYRESISTFIAELDSHRKPKVFDRVVSEGASKNLPLNPLDAENIQPLEGTRNGGRSLLNTEE